MSPTHPISHKQVPAKVTAYVDEDIKELIEAINHVEGIWTSESCQGYEGEIVEILAFYRSLKDYDYLDTAQFVERLTHNIKNVVIDEMGWLYHSIWISLQWGGDMRFPCIKFECGIKDVRKVTKVFKSLRRRIV